MPDPALRRPPQELPVLEHEASVALDTHTGTGFGTLAMDAVNSTWVGAFGLRSLYRGLQGSDDSFEMTPDKLKVYGEGLPNDYLPLFADAVSHEDALQIRRNALSLYQSRERLAGAGYGGIALQFGAAVLDPVNLATGAVAGTVGATAKASRLMNMARVGLANVAAAAIPETYLTAQDPDRQNSDMLISMTAALALGGGVGAYQFSKLNKAAMLADAATTPSVKLTEKGVNDSFALASEAVTTGNRIIGVAADADGGTATNPSFWFNQQPATNPDFWTSPPAATNPGFWLDRAAPDAPLATNPKWSYHSPDTFPRWSYDTPDTNPSFWLDRPAPAAEAEAVAAQGPKWSYVVPDTTPRWSYDTPDTNPEWSYRGDSAVTVDVERIADASEAAVKQAAAEVAAEAAAKGEIVVVDVAGSPVPTTTFTTAKGSTYEVRPDGSTVRNKAARPEHPGESGIQPASSKTYYLTQADADKLSLVQANYPKGVSVGIAERPDGTVGVKYTSGPEAGKFIRDAVVKPQASPAVGLMPLEVFDNGGVHFGNKIVSVGSPVPPTGTVTTTPSPWDGTGTFEGWKLHLTTQDPDGVSKALSDLGYKHKVGRNSGQTGKDVTVYVGHKDAATTAAKAINEKIGNLLQEAPAGSDVLSDDISFGGKVMGRFDTARGSGFHQYGSDGVPFLENDMDPYNPTGSLADRASRATDALRNKYGDVFTGSSTATTTPSKGLGTAAAGDPNVQAVSVAPPKNMRPGDLDFSSAVGKELPMPAMSKYRIGVFGKALGIANKSSLMNKMMAFVAEDVLPRAGLYGGDAPVPVIQSASEWRRFTASGIVSKFQKKFDAAFETTGPSLNPWKRAAERRAFNEEVSIAARHMPGKYTDNHAINAAADAWRALKGESADYAQRYGVEGFDQFDVNAGDYFTRQGDHARIQQAIADYGLESVEAVVAEAIRRRPKLDESALFPDAFAFTEEQVKLAARAWINMQGGYGEVSGLGRTLALSTSPAERLAEAARTIPGITEDQIKSVVAMLESTSEAPRAKLRMPMDESTVIKPLAKYNPSAKDELRFTDLLFNNVEAHARTYTNDTLGLAAMKKVLEGMSAGPGDVIASPASLLRRLDQDMIDANVPISERKRAISYAESYLRHVQGLPIVDKVSRANQAAQIATGLNYAVRGGSFVIANAFELGGALTEAGVRGLFRAIPEMGAIIRNAATGATDSPNVRFISEVLGVGNENWVHRVVGRMNYAGSAAEDVSGGLEQGLRHVGRFSSKYTGLEAVNVFLKQTTAAALLHNWARIAESGKLPSNWRLAAMGLTKADGEAITAQILKHAELNNGRVRDIHIDRWDPQTAAKFIVAVRKTASRAVQENDIGQYAPFMTRPVAKLLTQFRSFAIAAYEKQLLFNLSARDSKALGYFIASSMAGTLSYMGSVINNAAGRPDAKDYLNKRLAPDKLAMGAFSRAGYSSILTIPADYVLGGMGYDAPFSAGRTSGLDSDPLFGNPSFQMLVNARKLPSFARAAYDGKFKVSRDMFGAARTFVPLQGVPVIKQFLDQFQWTLPRESTPRR